MKRFILATVAVASALTLAACQDDATIASHNISRAAERHHR
jgi:predicted small secreted protein